MPDGTSDLFIENRTFDELTIGETASLSHTATKRDIDLFATVTGGMSMKRSILTLNAGSSSVKFALFDPAAKLQAASLKATVRGEIEDLDAAPHLLARDAAGTVLAEKR